MILEGLFGGLLGGIMRLAPEVIKFFGAKEENRHELEMFKLQTDLEKIKGANQIEEKYVDFSTASLDALSEAYKEQAAAVSKGSQWLANLSGSVRPGIAWALFSVYFIFKISMLISGIASGQPWLIVLGAYNEADHALLNMVIGYYFVQRSIEKYQK